LYMKNAYNKNLIRTIKRSKGRFFAILAIIMLGVGFFAGLKTTKPSMVGTANEYFRNTKLYDFRVLSNLGFTDESIESFDKSDLVLSAEGSYFEDFIFVRDDGEEDVITARTIGKKINLPYLLSGRMPSSGNECLVDRRLFGSDCLGKTIKVSSSNKKNTLDVMKYDEYIITGVCISPYYTSFERGTTSIGRGNVSGFIYVGDGGLSFDFYKEAFLICQDDLDIYTDEYKDFIEEITPKIEDLADDIANERYDGISAVNMMDSLFGSFLLNGVSGLSEIDNLKDGPASYVMDRNTNQGYQGYENDTTIVQDVAKVFPIFFFLIAALVCSTTMTRMIDDERGQLGTFRALGYTDFEVMKKYLVYSGVSSIIGCITGFFIGTWLFPFVIAKTYGMMYDFDKFTVYTFSPLLLIICIIVALLCSTGMAYIACMGELREMPANLIRPKAPAAGKRIFLERIGFIWKRMKFLHKVTARNVFRFKKRMFMMIIGIAGCTALVITGLGLHDSIANLAEFQYGEIETYDISLILSDSADDEMREDINKRLAKSGAGDSEIAELYRSTAEMRLEDSVKTIYVCAAEGDQLPGFVNFNDDKGNSVPYPGIGDAIVSDKLCEMTGTDVGDIVTFYDSDDNEIKLRISGKYKNFVYYYVYITPETYEKCWGEKYAPNSMYIKIKGNESPEEEPSEELIYSAGAELSNSKYIFSVNIIPELRKRVIDMMHNLNAVVFLVIGSAALLAFVVLFNLSNINITERVREIATIKVLGFYSNETGAYVMRESLILTLMGIVVGIPLGILLHGFVMSEIKVDVVSFDARIMPLSFVLSVAIVIMFAIIVDLIMRPRLEAIDMAESLKSAE